MGPSGILGARDPLSGSFHHATHMAGALPTRWQVQGTDSNSPDSGGGLPPPSEDSDSSHQVGAAPKLQGPHPPARAADGLPPSPVLCPTMEAKSEHAPCIAVSGTRNMNLRVTILQSDKALLSLLPELFGPQKTFHQG